MSPSSSSVARLHSLPSIPSALDRNSFFLFLSFSLSLHLLRQPASLADAVAPRAVHRRDAISRDIAPSYSRIVRTTTPVTRFFCCFSSFPAIALSSPPPVSSASSFSPPFRRTLAPDSAQRILVRYCHSLLFAKIARTLARTIVPAITR